MPPPASALQDVAMVADPPGRIFSVMVSEPEGRGAGDFGGRPPSDDAGPAEPVSWRSCYDILKHQAKSYTEIVEIDLASRAVVGTYRSDAAARFESASNFLVVGRDKTPVFLMTLRVPGEDTTLWLFRPER
jgi:hypothetical protein